jgi:hypothetical protein
MDAALSTKEDAYPTNTVRAVPPLNRGDKEQRWDWILSLPIIRKRAK